MRALRGKPIKAKKLLKDRVTILVGAAMDGHKFKPLLIGKSLNPRCLKNVDRSTLPVHYYAKNSTWMAMTTEFHCWDQTAAKHEGWQQMQQI